jgi:hypothetical protein
MYVSDGAAYLPLGSTPLCDTASLPNIEELVLWLGVGRRALDLQGAATSSAAAFAGLRFLPAVVDAMRQHLATRAGAARTFLADLEVALKNDGRCFEGAKFTLPVYWPQEFSQGELH